MELTKKLGYLSLEEPPFDIYHFTLDFLNSNKGKEFLPEHYISKLLSSVKDHNVSTYHLNNFKKNVLGSTSMFNIIIDDDYILDFQKFFFLENRDFMDYYKLIRDEDILDKQKWTFPFYFEIQDSMESNIKENINNILNHTDEELYNKRKSYCSDYGYKHYDIEKNEDETKTKINGLTRKQWKDYLSKRDNIKLPYQEELITKYNQCLEEMEIGE